MKTKTWSLLAAALMIFCWTASAQAIFPDSCVSSGVHFSKLLYYAQTGSGVLVPDSTSRPLFQAVTNLGTAPHGNLSSAILRVPTVPEKVLDFAQTPVNERLSSPTELDAAYPQVGTYRIDLATSSGSGSFQLSFAPTGWPPEPEVLNFTAAQAIHPGADFALQLKPFTGSDTYRIITAIMISIAFPPQIILLDPLLPCAPVNYPHVPDAIAIPRGTLMPSQDYFVVLTYARLQVAPITIGGFTAASVLGKTTRVPIRTTDGRNPIFQNVRRAGSKLIFELQVPASPLIEVETASSLASPNWQNVTSFASAREQTISVTNMISTQTSAAFFRAVAQ